jgi:hypothetical protein
MSGKFNLELIEQKSYSAYFQDGFYEILLGSSLLAVGFFLTLLTTGVNVFVILILFWIIVLPLYLVKFGLRTAKKRFIYPRMGYVTLPQDFIFEDKFAGRTAISFILLVTAPLLLWAVARGNESALKFWEFWTPIWIGVMLMGLFIYLAIRTGIARFYFTGFMLLVFSVVTLMINIMPFAKILLQLFGVGGVLMVIGITVFLTFLRKIPVNMKGGTDASI